jgi:hypothetical protein
VAGAVPGQLVGAHGFHSPTVAHVSHQSHLGLVYISAARRAGEQVLGVANLLP